MIYRHPIHTQYGADADGNVYSLKSGEPRKLSVGKKYGKFCISSGGKAVTPKANRFVYECCNQEIVPKGLYVVKKDQSMGIQYSNLTVDNKRPRTSNPRKRKRKRKSSLGVWETGNITPELALDILKNRIPDHLLSKATGLSVETLEELRRSKQVKGFFSTQTR